MAYPRQTTTVDDLGSSLRQIQRGYEELEGKYIISRRLIGTATTRFLVWSGVTPRVAQRHAAGGATDTPRAARELRTKVLNQEQPTETEPNPETTPCETCGDTGLVHGKGCQVCEKGKRVIDIQTRRRA